MDLKGPQMDLPSVITFRTSACRAGILTQMCSLGPAAIIPSILTVSTEG